VDRACASRRDALDRAQVLWTLADDLEHAVAKAPDCLRRPDRTQIYLPSRLERLEGRTIPCPSIGRGPFA
jgi:hypothetical protein